MKTYKYLASRVAMVCALIACFAATAGAQSFTYTFGSGPFGDGFNWPASPTGLLEFDSFYTPQDVYIYNDTGNNAFFDQQYQVAGNSTRIDGDALWGNPLDSGYGYIAFDFNNMSTLPTDVIFDFAWSESGVPATSDFLSIYIEDSEGRASFNSWQLTDAFTGFGGSTGYEGTIHLSTSYLTDDYFNVDGGSYADIYYMEIHVGDIAGSGPSAEYAIDNFFIGEGGGGELDPENSDLYFGYSGVSTNRLRSTLPGSYFNFDGIPVNNFGTGGTTYSVTLDPSSDPEFSLESPTSSAFIAGEQEIEDGTGTIASIDTSIPSGEYVATATLTNDLNPLDPDDQVTYTIKIYDPPSLADDSGATVQVDSDPTIFLSNAAAGPHAGALRAGVEVSNRQVSGPFKFSTSTGDLINGAIVQAGETKTATIEFDRYGRLNGAYNGTASLDLAMKSDTSFLNGAQPVPSINWNLSYNLGTTVSDSVALSTNDPLGPSVVGVNDAEIAATLLDGQSAANQNVSMAFSLDPDPAGADLAGDPIELTFSSGNVDLYVLQFTYLDGNLPGGITESQLQVLFYDSLAGEWDAAVDGNSGGSTTFFNGSYADYLATVGGGVLDNTDLGAFGVDTFNNHAWAILDHASIFGVGVLAEGLLEGDLNGDGFVGLADLDIVLGNWNQNVTPGSLPDGDPSGDGFVGLADLDTVLGNWNAGTPPTESANIPEPGTLVVIGLLACASTKRRGVAR